MSERTRDPLALTILLAAILLAALWWWEKSQSERLLEANAAAQDYSRDYLGADCEAYAAGPEGTTLVIHCPESTTSDMQNALDPDGASAFDEWLLVGVSGDRMRCDVTPNPACSAAETAY